MKVAFGTLFDRHYLGRGLLMIRSLRRQWSSAGLRIYVLCLDRSVLEYFWRFPEPGVQVMALEELEAADPALLVAKLKRSRLEYYFTLSPCWPRYLLLSGDWEAVVSLDADLFFYGDPLPLVELLVDRPIFITAHGYERKVRRRGLRTGRFNVSFQGFRKDPVALACQVVDSVLGAVTGRGRLGFWRRWWAQTYFDLSGVGVRHVDLSGWHWRQRGWRWAKMKYPPPSPGGCRVGGVGVPGCGGRGGVGGWGKGGKDYLESGAISALFRKDRRSYG